MFRKQKHQEDGLNILEKTLYLNRDKVTISPILNLLQILLSLLGVYGCAVSFLSGFDIPVTPWFLPGLVLCVVYFNILYRYKQYMKYSIPGTFLLYLLILNFNWDKFQNGLWHIENYVIDSLNRYYGLNLLKYLVDGYVKEEVVTLFMLFITVLLALLITSVIYGRGTRLLFTLTTLPLVAASFVVGRIPSAGPLGAYLVCGISIIGMSLSARENMGESGHKKKKGTTKELRHREKRISYLISLKTGGFIAAIVMLLMLVIPLVFTQKTYNKKIDVTSLKQKLQKGMWEFNLQEVINNLELPKLNDVELFGSVASGGLSSGKLGRIGEVVFNNKTALRIQTVPLGDTMYLKGFVGSTYTGNAWEGLTQSQRSEYKTIADHWEGGGFSIGNQSSYYMSLLERLDPRSFYNFSFYRGFIDITSVNSNRSYVYAPYQTVYPESMNIDNSEYVTTGKRLKEYNFSYYGNYKDIYGYNEREANLIQEIYYGSSETLPSQTEQTRADLAEYKLYEQAYRDFVTKTYTALPENSLLRLKKYFNDYTYSDREELYDKKNKVEIIIEIVRDMVNNGTVYSLSPGVLPKGEDFIEYFLFDKKAGYCAHYASTATMLFRMFSVPARYVEGYVVKSENIAKGKVVGKENVTTYIEGERREITAYVKDIQITDANAHSWVEIYLDGFGWVPVEVTPGFNQGSGAPDLPKEQETEVIPTVTPKPSPTVTPVQKPDEEKNNTKDAAKEKDNGKGIHNLSASIQTILYITGIAAVAIVLLLARKRYLYVKRIKLFNKADFSERTLLSYQYFIKALLFLKICKEDKEEQIGKSLEKCLPNIKALEYMRYMEIVRKAKFSQNCLTEEEAFEADTFYQKVIGAIYMKANLASRIYLKYVKVLWMK